jgi:hypothetical protein
VAEGRKLPISVVISAVDNVTYRVMAINEKLKRITAPVKKVRQAFSALGEEAGLGKLMTGLGKVASTGKEFFSELSSMVFRVGAAGFAAAGGIFALTRSFADAGDDVKKMSERLGLTTDAYQELAFAAKMANVDQETFDSSMSKFSRGIAEAAVGQGEAITGFSALGISVRDATGHVRSLESLLPEVANKMNKIQNQSVRNAIAAKIFGKEGMKLNGIFQEGAEGLEKLRKEAHRVGAVMTPEQIEAATKFDDAFKSIGATLLMVRNVVGAALAPVLVDLGTKLQTYILNHQEDIKKFAAAFAEKLPDVLSQIGQLLQNLGPIVMVAVRAFNWLSSVFGEVNVAAAGLFAWFGGFKVLGSLFNFIRAIGGVLPTALRFAWTAISLVAGVIADLVAALAALVGWPVVVAAALIAAAIAIWKWWEPISKFVVGVWDKFKGFFGGKTEITQNSIGGSSPAFGPALGTMGNVDAATRIDGQRSESHVLVEFQNAPKGTRVKNASQSQATELELKLGVSMQGAG